jgi:hypothetical protein
MHKVEARRIFLTLLTESVLHMLKLHRMMDEQFFSVSQCLGNWM